MQSYSPTSPLQVAVRVTPRVSAVSVQIPVSLAPRWLARHPGQALQKDNRLEQQCNRTWSRGRTGKCRFLRTVKLVAEWDEVRKLRRPTGSSADHVAGRVSSLGVHPRTLQPCRVPERLRTSERPNESVSTLGWKSSVSTATSPHRTRDLSGRRCQRLRPYVAASQAPRVVELQPQYARCSALHRAEANYGCTPRPGGRVHHSA